MGTLTSKTAIVTGASRGIGRAIAERLAADGARVVLAARDEAVLTEAVSKINGAGGEAASLALDLRREDAPGKLAAFAVETFGGIDIVVNNAGATKRGDFLTLTEEDWADGFALKFYAAVRLSRAAWPHLKASDLKASGGSILNIVGVGGRTPGAEFAIGGSVNAAILSLTKALAGRGVTDGVQVNAINPGPVRTDRFARTLAARADAERVDAVEAEKRMVQAAGITRVGEPEDIAALAAFVVSPAGRLLQGSLLDMDGGQTKTI